MNLLKQIAARFGDCCIDGAGYVTGGLIAFTLIILIF